MPGLVDPVRCPESQPGGAPASRGNGLPARICRTAQIRNALPQTRAAFSAALNVALGRMTTLVFAGSAM